MLDYFQSDPEYGRAFVGVLDNIKTTQDVAYLVSCLLHAIHSIGDGYKYTKHPHERPTMAVRENVKDIEYG